ncbi:23S rRNA (pseudouridine(1915)-N(3))-methyltransferase RlmH [Bermanella sp. 47_1433_sub80_T6]|nr:23S rRNA (pseudouridine(1915)-N(3))-methyltransferase RlmH [Bermanella sp. 47_1433_sub80_T6]
MKIRLIAVGTKMPSWVQEGFAEYTKRLPHDCRIELIELPIGPRGKNQPVSKAIEKEGQAMLAAMKPQNTCVALEVLGKPWSTEQLAKQMSGWRMEGQDVDLLVGGPDGLSPKCTQKATQKWSLSPLTLPHPLVRVLLAEQLYRAWTINNNHPYHK